MAANLWLELVWVGDNDDLSMTTTTDYNLPKVMNLYYLLLPCNFISWSCVVFCVHKASIAGGIDSSCQNSCLDMSVRCDDILIRGGVRVKANVTHSLITN